MLIPFVLERSANVLNARDLSLLQDAGIIGPEFDCTETDLRPNWSLI
ncbi:MAG: hypothetical protein L3J02_00955 [Henriciella sp.]|nr:hypothetical protein [Henriciella sp.]